MMLLAVSTVGVSPPSCNASGCNGCSNDSAVADLLRVCTPSRASARFSAARIALLSSCSALSWRVTLLTEPVFEPVFEPVSVFRDAALLLLRTALLTLQLQFVAVLAALLLQTVLLLLLLLLGCSSTVRVARNAAVSDETSRCCNGSN
jgi:hypothetical protein